MRQKARRDARTVTSKRRAALLERARRLEDLAVQVMTAIGERDAAVAAAEQRAGNALGEMTTVQGVTLREAVEWCGDQIGVREATRLRRLAENDPNAATALPATVAPSASGSRRRKGGWVMPASRQLRRRSQTRGYWALPPVLGHGG